MCGITGATWTSGGDALDRGILDRMTDVLKHRGPDGRGTHLEQADDGSGVALGHRRLSIIDLAGGKQPLSNEDGTVWITFNGEIYNYRELRADLEAAGHRFRTDSDTETIVHLYEQFGDKCLDKLRGMFAFAVWDRRRRRLLLARDRLGQKPLVYREEPGRLLFASEIKALLQVPGVPREVDPLAIDEYLTYLYVPHPRTMFRGIHKLPPGHCAVYENGKLSITRYWNPDLNFESSDSQAELRERLAATLDDSVRLRLRSDVPLGAFLSGGIDSTAIVGLMQRHSAQPTKTYTIGFPVADYNESEFALAAAEHLGTDHHESIVEPESIGVLPTLTWHFDEPFGDSSAIPTYYVSQVTRRHVTVALTGDGGDELFAGYPRYRTVAGLGAFDRLPRPIRRLMTGPLRNLLGAGNREDSLARRLRFRLGILREPHDRRYMNWVATFHDQRRHAIYSNDLAAKLESSDPPGFVAEAMGRCSRRAVGQQAMLTDLQTYLPCDLLAKVDITSMAHGLECRSPFLDHEVVELALSIPYRHMVRGRETKPMLTSTFADLIPPSLRTRDKMGFRIPLDHWFRNDLRAYARETLLGQASLSRGYFRRQAVEDLLEEHTSGRWNHGDRIWTLLCLEMWHRTFIDPADPPTAPLEDPDAMGQVQQGASVPWEPTTKSTDRHTDR